MDKNMEQHVYISLAHTPKQFGWTEEVINESSNGPIKMMMMEGEFQRAETPNRNNRVYPRALLERETKKLQSFIEERNGLPLGMDHPLPDTSEVGQILINRLGMENACALGIHLEMQGDVVYGKARVLEGDHGTGDKLAAMLRAGFKPGISSRGTGGKPNYTPEGYVLIPEDYQMLTFDIVSNPSTRNAILQRQLNEEFESHNRHQRKLWDVMIDLKAKHS